MTRYAADLDCPVAFDEQVVPDTLAETLAQAGARQLHVAETEKYAHVTYFFNGGEETEWPGEKRILVPSPRDVPSYDLKPAMSAPEVADLFTGEIGDGYRFAVINFANPDMVGHTGVIPAVVEAVETVDRCLGAVVDATQAARRRLPRHCGSRQRGAAAGRRRRQPAHRPYDEPGAADPDEPCANACATGGELSDLAPTVLELLGLEVRCARPRSACSDGDVDPGQESSRKNR